MIWINRKLAGEEGTRTSRSIRAIQHDVLNAPSLTSILAAGLLLGPVDIAFAQDAYPHANEPIGNVEQIYDGALTPDCGEHLPQY